jgi:hypothetical protein
MKRCSFRFGSFPEAVVDSNHFGLSLDNGFLGGVRKLPEVWSPLNLKRSLATVRVVREGMMFFAPPNVRDGIEGLGKWATK